MYTSESSKEQARTQVKIEGNQIEFYLDSYYSSGFDQYFKGEYKIIQNSLLIHVEEYYTLSRNTGRIVRYKNCPEHQVQRLRLKEVSTGKLKLEIIEGSSLLELISFFDSSSLTFYRNSDIYSEFKKLLAQRAGLKEHSISYHMIDCQTRN